jgi:hypothetical protein
VLLLNHAGSVQIVLPAPGTPLHWPNISSGTTEVHTKIDQALSSLLLTITINRGSTATSDCIKDQTAGLRAGVEREINI